MKTLGSFKRVTWLLIFLLLWGTAPATAGLFDSLSNEKERQIGEEFFLELQSTYPISTDPFISCYINRLGHKLEAQQPPHAFQIPLLRPGRTDLECLCRARGIRIRAQRSYPPDGSGRGIGRNHGP